MKRRKTYQVAEAFEDVALSEWVPADSGISMMLTYHHSGIDSAGSTTATYNLITETDLRQFILQHWEWSYFDTMGVATAFAAFWATWNMWKENNHDDIERMATAWFNPYDPLNNYNSYEQSKTERFYDSLTEDHEFGTETRTFGKVTETKGGGVDSIEYGEHKRTNTPASYTHTIAGDTQNGKRAQYGVGPEVGILVDGTGLTEETSVSTYDTAQKATEKVEQKGDAGYSSKERFQYDNTTNETDNQHTDKYTYAQRTNTIEHATSDTITRMPETIITDGGYSDTAAMLRYGNIGVTTSQQMLEAEITMRLNGLKTRLLDNFLSTWFGLFGGECDDY